MDIKTLDSSGAKAVAEQLRTEILDVLALGVPLTSRDLYDRCESAEEMSNMTYQLGQLQKLGKIEKAGMRASSAMTRGARAVPEYRLVAADSTAQAPEPPALNTAEAAQLAAVIEATLKPIDAPLPDLASDFAPEDVPHRGDESRATGEAQDGDEFAGAPIPHPAYNPATVAFRPARRGDPIIHLIERMDDYPEPKLQEGAMHEARFAALVARLERGLPIYPDPDLNAYLADVRDLFGVLAASTTPA